LRSNQLNEVMMLLACWRTYWASDRKDQSWNTHDKTFSYAFTVFLLL